MSKYYKLWLKQLKKLFIKSEVKEIIKPTPAYSDNTVLRIECNEKYPEILDWLNINTNGLVSITPINKISDSITEVSLEFHSRDDALTFIIRYPDVQSS